MKTKAQYEAANANYWVGCEGTINKECSVQAEFGSCPAAGSGSAGPNCPSPHKPRAPREKVEGSSPVPLTQPSWMPV